MGFLLFPTPGYSDEMEAALGHRYGADTGDEDYVLVRGGQRGR